MNHQPEEKKMARLFFALWPESSGRTALAAWQPALNALCCGRIMRPETLHATLVFLGDVALHRTEALRLAAEEVEGRRFDLAFGQACYWEHNHVVYAAPRNAPPELLQLVTDLRERLAAHRFHFDSQAYIPHVTLLRCGRCGNTPLPPMKDVTWRVRDFVLVQSASDGRGANYRVLARFPFAVV